MIIRERRVKGKRRQSSSRGNHRKKSKGKQGRAAGNTKRKRVEGNKLTEQRKGNKRKKSKGEQGRAAAWGNKRKKSKGEQEDRATAGIKVERRVKGNKPEQQGIKREKE